MIVYQSTLGGFLADAFTRDIEDVVSAKFRARLGRSVGRSEIRSWKDSLLAVGKVLNHDAFPKDCGIAIEYGIPQTSKRIDVIIAGQNADARDQLIIVELKQREFARKTRKNGIVPTRFEHGEAQVRGCGSRRQIWLLEQEIVVLVEAAELLACPVDRVDLYCYCFSTGTCIGPRK